MEDKFSSIGVYTDNKADLERLQQEYAEKLGLVKKPAFAQVILFLIHEHDTANAVSVSQ